MIKIGEKEYRKIKALNQSMIKLFGTDPVKFFEQFKLGKLPKEKKSVSLLLGDLVDFYLLECKGNEEEFERRLDERFSIFDGKKTGAQVYVLVDKLFEITLDDMEDGEIKTSFEQRFTKACKEIKETGRYSGKNEDFILKDFNENGYTYFKTLIDNLGKIVIDEYLIGKARKISFNILNDPFTKDLFEKDILRKVPIEWKYTCKSGKVMLCKSEIDFMYVDEAKKQIHLYDLKTTYDNEAFILGYLKNGYYIQGAFYYYAVKYWAQEKFKDFEVLPMQFVVADTSSNNRRPIIYRTSQEDLEKGLEGFQLCDQEYKGVKSLIEDICWAEDFNRWNVSREVFENKGILNLGLKYV